MILVVGGTGQVGSAVVRGLRARDVAVRVLLRASSNGDALNAVGARIVRGDLRDPGSLRGICEGVDCVVATANTIVPRAGERADFDGLARGYQELGRVARAAGVRRFIFVSVPRELMGHGAQDFDAKQRIESALATDGPPLTVARASLLMEVWLPWLGSRLPLRLSEQATLERGYWFTRLAGGVLHRTLDRFGVVLVTGSGNARHAFISVDDFAQALVELAVSGDGRDEYRIGGPETLSWREAAEILGGVLGVRVRVVPQPSAPYRALAALTRSLSPALSQLLASQVLVAKIDTPFPPDDARLLLRREPTSVETFLSSRRTA